MSRTHGKGYGRPRHEQRDPNRRWQTAKCSELEVCVIRELRWNGRLRYSDLQRMFGRSYRALWAICNGETWTHLPMPEIRRVAA